MKTTDTTTTQTMNFDLVRIEKAKSAVGIAPITLRRWTKLGLKIYKVDKAAFFSKIELDTFIRRQDELHRMESQVLAKAAA